MPAHLYVRRPSPTTVCFTVSNAPSRQTWSAKLAFAVEILLRAVIFALVLLTDAAKLRHLDLGILRGRIDWTTGVGRMAARLADRYHWSIVAGASAVLIYAVWRRRYTGAHSRFPLCRAGTNSGILRRGVAARYPWARRANIDIILHVLVQRDNEVYSDDSDPRHCYPRSIQRVRSALLLGYYC